MSRTLTVLVVAALVLTAVPGPVGAIHEHDDGDPVTADDIHGDLHAPADVTSSLFLHCTTSGGECAGDRNFQAAGLGDSATDPTGLTGPSTLTYSFVRAGDGSPNPMWPGDIERVETVLWIEKQVTEGEFSVRFLVDGEVVGESPSQTISAGVEPEEVRFVVDLQDDPAVIDGDSTMSIEIVGQDGWVLHLHGSDVPSRVEMTGQLLKTRSWLEPPEGGTRDFFNVIGTEDARTFRPLMSVRPALGPGMIWQVGAHDHAGGGDLFGVTADLHYRPVDEGIEADDPVSDDPACGFPTTLEHDARNSSLDRPLLNRTGDGSDHGPCTIDHDRDLAGNWSFDFTLPGKTIAGFDALRCGGTAGCTDPVPVQLADNAAFDIELDRDDGFKEVLAGEDLHYNLRVSNGLAAALDADLTISGPDRDNWTATLSDDQVTVPGGGSVGVELVVTPPVSASTNEDATTTVTVSSADFERTRSVAVTAVVGSEATFDADVLGDEAAAAPGDRATFLAKITNDGNTRETLHLSTSFDEEALFVTIYQHLLEEGHSEESAQEEAQKQVAEFVGGSSVTMERTSMTLDAGERDQVRVHVDVAEETPEALLGATAPLQTEVRSTSADEVVGNGTLTLDVLASYGFDVDVFHPTHSLRTSTGTSTDTESPCADEIANTTFGSWFRITVENTGGRADTIALTDLPVQQADGEDGANWDVAAFATPNATPGKAESLDEIPLPAGNKEVEFYVLANRSDRNANDNEIHDQCDPTGDSWEDGDAISFGVPMESVNQPSNKARPVLRLEAVGDAFEPGVELEPNFFVRPGEDGGVGEVREVTQPRPMPPGETQELTFRFTNTGNHECVREGADAYRAFFTGIPWEAEVDTATLEGLGGIQTGSTAGSTVGEDSGDLSVSYNDTLLRVDVTVTERAEAGQTFDGQLHIDATCQIPGTTETASASDTIPVEFVVTEKDGLDVSTRPATGEVEVQPGQEAMVNVAVRNTGSTRPTFNVSLGSSALPSGWQARIVGLDSLEIPPLSTAYVPVGIRAPASADPDAAGSVDVTVTASESDLQETVSVGATTVDRGNLSSTVETRIQGVEPGSSVSYNVTITNEGDADVTLEGADASLRGVPDDWSGAVLRADDGSRFIDDRELEIPAGESRSLIVEISAPPDTLAVSTVGTTLVVDKPPNGTIAETLRTHIASEFGVGLSALPSSLAVRAEDVARYKLRVTNEGNGVDTIRLDHESPPSGWSISIPADQQELVLGAFETTSVPVTVDPPSDAPPGVTVPLRVTATSATRTNETASLTLSTTVASYDPEIRADPSPRRVGPGQAMNFPITVVNNGTGTDTIELSTSAKPRGWRVEFSRAPLDLTGGESAEVTVKVTPSATAAARSENLVVVQADSTFAPEETDSVTFEVSIADYLSRDVDDDGIPEAAIDTDGNVANGYERFHETDNLRGIVSSEVVAFDGDDDGNPDFLIDTDSDADPDVYWSPVGEVFTDTTVLDIEGDTVDDFLIDVDADGSVDAVYRPEDEVVSEATSFDVDGDLSPEYLADSTGDGRLDRYVDTGDPRPGYAVRTATAIVSETSYAVDTDGDGSHDTVVDVQDETTRAFTMADAAVRLMTTYWYAMVLFVLVVVLFGAVRLVAPRQRYVYQDYED